MRTLACLPMTEWRKSKPMHGPLYVRLRNRLILILIRPLHPRLRVGSTGSPSWRTMRHHPLFRLMRKKSRILLTLPSSYVSISSLDISPSLNYRRWPAKASYLSDWPNATHQHAQHASMLRQLNAHGATRNGRTSNLPNSNVQERWCQ